MTRILYQWQSMIVGDQIAVMANCSDSSIVYRIGIRDKDGVVDYRQGSGNQSHIFYIDVSGDYTVYVENRSSTKTMRVTGRVSYPN